MKYYIFGAGQNAYGVLDFFGREDCVALIDNDENKWGCEKFGVTTYGVDYLERNYSGEPVIISPLKYGEELSNQLREKNIENVYMAPNFLGGYYSTPDDLINSSGMDKEKKINIYGDNPLSKHVIQRLIELGKSKESINVYDKGDYPRDEKVYILGGEDRKKIKNDKKCVFIDLTDICYKRRDNIKKYRNVHKGERCFIVCNGPSLIATDLENIELNGDISFGCNDIDFMFDKTNWRPTYYVVIDNEQIFSTQRRVQAIQDGKTQVFCRDVNRSEEKYHIEGAEYFNCLNHIEDVEFSLELEKYAVSPSTVSYVMLQFAVYMGFNEIYILGADMGDIDKHFFNVEINESGINNKVKEDKVRDWIRHYEYARQLFNDKGIKIYNATRGGYLEVFERKNIEELF